MQKPYSANQADPWVALAIQAVHTFVVSGRVLPLPQPIPQEMTGKAGVFVSIKKAGQLRGCIGTFLPAQANVAQEIIANAIKSASEDPRFPPVHESELPALLFSVDVLSEPEACTEDQLDPACFGVIVQNGWRRGLLLPDLEGVITVRDQIAIAKSKAGIGPGEKARLSRFSVERHKEHA